MQRENLWAPWRMEYIQSLTDDSIPCFMCHYHDSPQDDEKNFVLWRTPNCIVMFNRFPYNNGHILIAPIRHIPNFDAATNDELLELTKLTRDCQKVLSATINPHGFNVGMNIGRCAGAGLPDHMHIHIVPRWDGDTNFMAVCGQTEVVSQSMQDLYKKLKQKSKELNLPNI